jgi:hypothetical protein
MESFDRHKSPLEIDALLSKPIARSRLFLTSTHIVVGLRGVGLWCFFEDAERERKRLTVFPIRISVFARSLLSAHSAFRACRCIVRGFAHMASGGSVSRVYADVNAGKQREYWDYENYEIPWGFVPVFLLCVCVRCCCFFVFDPSLRNTWIISY